MVTDGLFMRLRMFPAGRRRLATVGFMLSLLLSPPLAGMAQTSSGLPLPRFVSLRADEANIRRGPGTRYPVEWVYLRQSMPFEVLAEFDNWRKIRDWEGTEGWVHSSMLSGRRTAVITGGTRALLREAGADAPPVARLAPGVIARLIECRDTWCRLEVDGYRGWLPRTHFWGVYPDETLD